MQKFINNPENLTSELLEGLVLSNPDIITLEQGNLIVNKKLAEADRVTIVTSVSDTHLTARRDCNGNKQMMPAKSCVAVDGFHNYIQLFGRENLYFFRLRLEHFYPSHEVFFYQPCCNGFF